MNKELNQSRLIVLPTGQVVGSPVTRRELKRQIRRRRLERRVLYRSLRSRGLNYETRGVVVRDALKGQGK